MKTEITQTFGTVNTSGQARQWVKLIVIVTLPLIGIGSLGFIINIAFFAFRPSDVQESMLLGFVSLSVLFALIVAVGILLRWLAMKSLGLRLQPYDWYLLADKCVPFAETGDDIKDAARYLAGFYKITAAKYLSAYSATSVPDLRMVAIANNAMALRKKQPSKSKKYWSRLLNVSDQLFRLGYKDDLEITLMRASSFHNLARLDEAIEACNAVISAEPNLLPNAYLIKCAASKAQGRLNEAREALNELELNASKHSVTGQVVAQFNSEKADLDTMQVKRDSNFAMIDTQPKLDALCSKSLLVIADDYRSHIGDFVRHVLPVLAEKVKGSDTSVGWLCRKEKGIKRYLKTKGIERNGCYYFRQGKLLDHIPAGFFDDTTADVIAKASKLLDSGSEHNDTN